MTLEIKNEEKVEKNDISEKEIQEFQKNLEHLELFCLSNLFFAILSFFPCFSYNCRHNRGILPDRHKLQDEVPRFDRDHSMTGHFLLLNQIASLPID